MTNRRTVAAGLLAAPLIVPLHSVARAQTWPNGPIRLIVPFPAGGSVDAVARIVQPGLEERLKTPVIIENKGGASGSVGAALAAKAPPDGQTFLFVFDTFAVNPALQPNIPFDTLRDFEPIMLIGTAPMVLACHESRPYTTFRDVLVASQASPTGLNYGSIGAGSLGHLAVTLLAKRSGAKLNHIPYRGGGPLINDAIAGHVELAVGSVSVLAAQIAAGKLRPLIQTARARVPTLKDTQTAIEAGFPDFDASAWWAALAPAGLPMAIRDRFHAALSETLKEARVRNVLVEQQQMQLVHSAPDEFTRFLRTEMSRWAGVVRDNNIRGAD